MLASAGTASNNNNSNSNDNSDNNDDNDNNNDNNDTSNNNDNDDNNVLILLLILILVIGYWLFGYWSSVIGYWLSVVGYWLLVIDHSERRLPAAPLSAGAPTRPVPQRPAGAGSAQPAPVAATWGSAKALPKHGW